MYLRVLQNEEGSVELAVLVHKGQGPPKHLRISITIMALTSPGTGRTGIAGDSRKTGGWTGDSNRKDDCGTICLNSSHTLPFFPSLLFNYQMHKSPINPLPLCAQPRAPAPPRHTTPSTPFHSFTLWLPFAAHRPKLRKLCLTLCLADASSHCTL
jgi:hypothetical protein